MTSHRDHEGKDARWWHALEGGALQCDLCPNRCRIGEGKRGICYVRANRGGRLVLESYGLISGLAADPIEKKPLYHFLPGTASLSFGVIGCNLSCRFCQNWHISKPADDGGLRERAAPVDIARLARRSSCPSVSFTYNEPIVTAEYTLDCARACRQEGLRTVAVTAGYIAPEPRAEFFRAMDAANVDLKAFSDDFYRRLCGIRLQPILDTLAWIRQETDCWIELTTLLIPGENDSDDELDRMTRWVVAELGPDAPMHFSAFYPTYRLTDHPSTPLDTLRKARAIARANGVRYAYTGNVHDDEGGSTYCHQCGGMLIARRGFGVASTHLESGRCPSCHTPCAGVFA